MKRTATLKDYVLLAPLSLKKKRGGKGGVKEGGEKTLVLILRKEKKSHAKK